VPRSYVPLSRSVINNLIDRARHGSLEASGELLEACRGYLLLIANGQLEAELRQKLGGSDLVQETFVQAHREFANFQGGSERELLAWLRKILLNQLAEARRDFQQTAKRDIARERPLGRDGSAGNGVIAVCPKETPSRQLAAAEEARRVDRAIANLPPRYAEVIRLRSRELCSFEVIGAQLEMGADAARKLWARAIERLQRELNDSDY